MALALEMRGITKRFPGVTANEHVDFQLAAGEIHALLGENGAGKTTLMHILYGLARPDEGDIVVRGAPVHLTSPRDAMACGIGMVHQHFMLVPALTVTENIDGQPRIALESRQQSRPAVQGEHHQRRRHRQRRE